MAATNAEFPSLSPLGLYARTIPGDGNCMFHALSDQIFGSINHSGEIRANVIEHVKEHKAHYINYIDVAPGGGTNRRPKRKNAAYAKYDAGAISEADKNRAFEHYVNNMAKKGTYGDNLEVAAFATHYAVHVRIFNSGADTSYVIQSQNMQASRPLPVAYIAYHADYEHYSSVRNVDGPHDGLPAIILPPGYDVVEEAAQVKPDLPTQWMVESVITSMPYPIDLEAAARALQANNNSVDEAVSQLLEIDAASSTPDVQSIQSSSVERELGSDEDSHSQDRKRQDRRRSRARQERQRNHLREQIASMSADSLDSLLNSSAGSSLRHSYGDSDASSPPPLDDGSTSPESDYSPPSEISIPAAAKPKITFRFSKPSEASAQAYPSKLILKHKSPKKGISARDAKALKKQAQKQARKERRQNEVNGDLMNIDSAASSFGGPQPVMTNGFRTMHI